jgi:hypothetical protein
VVGRYGGSWANGSDHGTPGAGLGIVGRKCGLTCDS